MLISTVVFPSARWTAGSLPSLWLFNAGPSRAQTSWRREAFPLSVRKHRSSATSSLQEARLNRSQKMQEDQPDSRICQKPPEFLFIEKEKFKRTGEEEEEGGEKRGGCKTVNEALGFIFLFILHRLPKGLHQQDRKGGEGAGVEEMPKNGTQKKTPENKGWRRWRRVAAAVPVLH